MSVVVQRKDLCTVKELKDKILREAQESAYSIHLGGNKMYHDLKATYWWYGMKRDVAAAFASARVEVERDCHGFYCGSTKNSVGI
jgi:ribosomal protein L31